MSAVEVAVIGAGLMGAATAWALGRRGVSAALFEAREFGHPAGSSHGSARIYRRAYPDPLYLRMTGLAGELWRELELAAGASVLRTTGGLDFGRRRDPAQIAARLAEAGVPHELMPASEASRRWPGFAFDGPVTYHPEAGVVDADLAVRSMLSEAARAGVPASASTPVRRIEPLAGGGVRLHLATGGSQVAGRVVVAAGAWMSDVLGGLTPLPELTVTQQQAFHFPRRDPNTEWPIFVYKGDDTASYGLPGGRDGGPGGAIKVAEHAEGSVTTGDSRDGVVSPASRARVTDYVRRRLPGLVPEPFAEASCLYTKTANEDFVLDRAGDVVVCSPCSGHGAKFAPLIGEIAADLAMGKTPFDPRFTLAAHGVPASLS
ncbi:FAD-dependent oxidoreductase [Dactylosporangium sp. AC04546]|uniref:FAD-dependent oxidoreductase n=1 Tax=Dactylosporangium sp. AC04546 TaxID=2862460 RepID=UPI001EDF4319|nr:FAD-dependent oxidoreductase [Dactylosporangium sp. AC04546]WVK86529.1 FAD-dependent oxidoreductase [Dactylosporangium sp. AC04546]